MPRRSNDLRVAREPGTYSPAWEALRCGEVVGTPQMAKPRRRCIIIQIQARGEMAEWFKAAVLKTAVGASLPGVRIPLSPPVLAHAPLVFWLTRSGRSASTALAPDRLVPKPFRPKRGSTYPSTQTSRCPTGEHKNCVDRTAALTLTWP